MTLELYILEGKDFRFATSLKEWGEFMKPRPDDPYYRHVAHTRYIVDGEEYCSLSTVFLGIDHNYSGAGDPILFESMIFGGVFDEEQWRYSEWNEARDQHHTIHFLTILPHINKKFESRLIYVRGAENSVGDLDLSYYYFKSKIRPQPKPLSTHRLIRED